MRNGNNSKNVALIPFQQTFYPTYEEWKQESNRKQDKEIETLFILPMRNGNQCRRFLAQRIVSAFLSYL